VDKRYITKICRVDLSRPRLRTDPEGEPVGSFLARATKEKTQGKGGSRRPHLFPANDMWVRPCVELTNAAEGDRQEKDRRPTQSAELDNAQGADGTGWGVISGQNYRAN